MIAASAFIALSTFLAKGVAGRFAPGEEGIHPLQITAGRFLAGWLVWLLIVAVVRPRRKPIHWGLHIGRSLFGWLTVTALFWASSRMALADATAISFLTPVFALLLAILFLHERVGWVRWSAVAIMLSGAVLLVRPGTSAFQPVALIALLSAAAGGVESTFIKRITGLEPRLQILLINNSIGLIIAFGAAWFVWVAPSAVQWALLMAVGVSMALAQVFFLTSMRAGEASYVTPFMYSTVIFASTLDYMVFGDAPDATAAIAILIIVAGATFLALRENFRANVTNPD